MARITVKAEEKKLELLFLQWSEHHKKLGNFSQGTLIFFAPYEADAQLAYMSGLEVEDGGVLAVILEDSDLLAYGCPAIVFKTVRYGNGKEIALDNVFNSVGCVPSFNGVSITKKKRIHQELILQPRSI
ncbi:uncharacterized protein [Henckelia pumila]|uniref:uncharacterized protein isoform X1 n=1 Tax=Henckelia pumila TaxID=405737 RepID=UPI003C6DD8F7